MKRVLCIVGGMNVGGAETFLMKIYRNLDRGLYQMDFAVSVDERGYYDDEIKELGGKIIHITNKKRGLIKNFISIIKVVKNNKYKYVLRTSQHSLSALELIAARLGGAKVCVFRSSNSHTGGGRLTSILHYVFRFLPKFCADVRLAPSVEAANFMYGKRFSSTGRVLWLHNGIDCDLYKYSPEKRSHFRELNRIKSDTVVMGHIGRFNWQKNHIRLVELFYEFHKQTPNSVLLLVGKGELEEMIRGKVKELGLSEHVIFLGVRSDIPDVLSALDVMVFPSFFEGMPNTIIEAQASGLPCVISNEITQEVRIINSLRFMPLEASNEEWVRVIRHICNERRIDNVDAVFKEREYHISSVVEQFVNYVFQGSR